MRVALQRIAHARSGDKGDASNVGLIANSPASMVTWVEEANRLRVALPPEVQATLLRHEQAGTTSHPDYVAATRVFYDRHLCRVPWPKGEAMGCWASGMVKAPVRSAAP